MIGILAFFVAASGQGNLADPNNLRIGREGSVSVKVGDLVDLRTSQTVTLADFVQAANQRPFVFLGEEHATAPHQQEEAAVIEALVAAGRKVTVGLEMFQRPKQDVLDQWSGGQLSESQFLDKSDWQHQWGYPYDFYRPVLEAVRKNHLSLVGLNVPRDWVHAVATGGFSTLPTSARLQLPIDLQLDNKGHREMFASMMGGHSMGEGGMANMYAAQVLWDTAMADTAVKYRALQQKNKANVFVVIAGAGHVMYGEGINYRIRHRHEGDGITLVMISSDHPVTVSKGLGDFVLVTKAVGKSE